MSKRQVKRGGWRRVGLRQGRNQKAFFQPWGEALEPRNLLDASGSGGYNEVSSAWFEGVPGVLQTPLAHFVGPIAAAVGSGGGNWQDSTAVAQWIVRLSPDATRQAGSLSGVAKLLGRNGVSFQVVKGLGLPGQVSVRSSAPDSEVRLALTGNANVTSFEPDAFVFSQQLPNDPDFATLTGLNNVGQFGSTVDADIDATEAWDETTGSTNVVVGVIDSGIDVTHPDLYLNVWINQGDSRRPPLATR